MEFPFAPPGMPTYFSVWETERCFEWLNRTVKRWSAEETAFYGTPDPEQFWAIGRCHAEVLWGGQEGTMESQYFLRLQMREGRAAALKLWTDPLFMLRAAGREVPVFRMDIHDEKVDEYLASHPAKPAAAEPPLNHDPEAREARIRANLDTNRCGAEREKYRALETNAPAFSGGVWFVPKEMDGIAHLHTPQRLEGGDFPPELAGRCFAWTKASSPWMYRDTRSVIYPTENPRFYFAELNGHGPGRWRGNGADDGHYHQPYLMLIELDEEGRLLRRDEILNPVNKYNSVNLTLPSFPYYY